MSGVVIDDRSLQPSSSPEVGPELYIPGTPPNTLGLKVVDNQDRLELAKEQHAEAVITANPGVAERMEGSIVGCDSMVEGSLSDIRQQMAGLSLGHSADFSRYCDTSAPQFLQDVKTQNAPNATWAEWLGATADREQLINFLQWHTAAIEQTNQNPKIVECIMQQKAEYKEALRKGIEEGWLHPDAEAALDNVDEIKVFASDLFDTSFAHRAGYHTFGTKSVVAAVIKNICKADEDPYKVILGLKFITKHELNHAVLAQIAKKVRWLNEAVTEHIAQVMDYGEPEIVNPHARGTKFGVTYGNERLILDRLLEEGDHKIPASMAMRAYSQSNSDEELSAFIEAVDESWAAYAPAGGSAYMNLNNFINSLEEEFMKKGMNQTEAGQEATKIALDTFKKSPQSVFSGKPTEIEEAVEAVIS